jgi:hypothetical protein
MRYAAGMKFDPPRPEIAVSPAQLASFEELGWQAQAKKNGTYAIIYMSPEGELRSTTRRHEPHKLWDWSEASSEAFERLTDRPPGWYVFCGELLHSKGTGVRDTIYLHDVIVGASKVLTGTPYEDRYASLRGLFAMNMDLTFEKTYWRATENTWIARNMHNSFEYNFDRLPPEDEGLVLKDPRGAWNISGRTSGMVKCRRPHKNYIF